MMIINAFNTCLTEQNTDQYIVVDDREKFLPAALYEHLGVVKKERLLLGDIVIKSRSSYDVFIENKTLYDLLCSYSTGRLQTQLDALHNCCFRYCFLFVLYSRMCSKSKSSASRTCYSSDHEKRVMKYLDRVPYIYPRIAVEVFKERSKLVECVGKIFHFISSKAHPRGP